jgi:hypothetical protein
MKKHSSFPIFIVAVMTLLLSCNTKQSADQYLNDDNQRKDIIASMVHHQSYMSEMMHEMMNNDSCKQMMGQSMMSDSGMTNMMMNDMVGMCNKDSSMCKTMMGKTMDMCDADPSKCKMMMGTMQSHPNVMNSMKGMCDMKNMK